MEQSDLLDTVDTLQALPGHPSSLWTVALSLGGLGAALTVVLICLCCQRPRDKLKTPAFVFRAAETDTRGSHRYTIQHVETGGTGYSKHAAMDNSASSMAEYCQIMP